MECVFCKKIEENDGIILSNDLAVAFYDLYPVNKGHTLVVPKRHVENYFDLTPDEAKAMFELSVKVKAMLDDLYHPDGYNIGFNIEECGGQSIMHTHMHVIPRYMGDSENPRGGIRKVLKKNKYIKY